MRAIDEFEMLKKKFPTACHEGGQETTRIQERTKATLHHFRSKYRRRDGIKYESCSLMLEHDEGGCLRSRGGIVCWKTRGATELKRE